MPEQLTALRTKALDAAVLNAELAIVARKEGFRELVDLAKVGLNFPTSSIVTTRAFIKRNENTVRKFIRGYVEGVHYGKTQRAFGVQVLKNIYGTTTLPSLTIYTIFISCKTFRKSRDLHRKP